MRPDTGTTLGDRFFLGVDGTSSSSVSDVRSFADFSGEDDASGKTSLLPSLSLRLILRPRFLGVGGLICEDEACDTVDVDAAET